MKTSGDKAGNKASSKAGNKAGDKKIDKESGGIGFSMLTWKQAAQTELFSGWQRWLSFACIWIWSCITVQVGFDEALMKQLPGVLGAPNELALLSLALFLGVILAFSKHIPSIVESRRFMILAAVLLCGGSALFALGMMTSMVWLYAFGMVAGGANIALLKIAWGEMFSRLSLRQGLLSMGYALIASTLVVLIMKDMPTILNAVLLVVVSVPCAPLLYYGTKKLDNNTENDAVSTAPVVFSSSLLLLPALVSLSFGIVKGMMPHMDVASTAFIDTALRFAELFVGAALLVFSFRLGKRFGAAQIYSIAIIFVVAGLILFVIESAPNWIPLAVVESGYALFYFFMVVYWGDLSRRTGMPIVRIYTIGYGAFQLAQVVGTAIGYYLVGEPSHSTAFLVLLSVVLAFFIVALLLFSNRHSSLRQWLVADEPRAEQSDDIPIACAKLTEVCGLSPREHEVLSLVARGRNASYVARVLYISPDTAKTHIKNIYRKLDVHTQQELIDLIDETIQVKLPE